MRLVLLGPPGAGKGTQAALLHDTYGAPHVATGEIFRTNIREGTELGEAAKQYIDRGDLVPDDVVIGMVMDRITEPDCADGFLLDGFPRTVAQAEALDRRLRRPSVPQEPLDAALNFEITEEELFRRLVGRAEREHRSDDAEDIVRHRLEVYHQKTEPLIDYYQRQGLLIPVDGIGTIDGVHGRIRASLEERVQVSAVPSDPR
ncbi:MAG TPA: adenylate kinase [Actinomycetes bacterium]|nr:adenylate kinase [Actinomycetes bacterium]